MAINPIKRIVFDPDARDADSDKKVQEGTPFERPAKPRIASKPKKKKYKNVATGCGDCFESAAKNLSTLVTENPERKNDYKLVHGVPLGTGGEAEGLRFNHSWVEETVRRTDDEVEEILKGIPEERRPFGKQFKQMLSEMVIVRDYSNGRKIDIPRDAYYAIGNIEKDLNQSYSYDEMIEQQVRTGHYGPYLTGKMISERRTYPLRETNVKDTDISTGGALKTSQIFDISSIKNLTEDGQASFLGVKKSTLQKMKNPDASISSFKADSIAINAFGMHPIEIWGDDWMNEQVLSPSKRDIPPSPLSVREQEILELRAQGVNDTDIGRQLSLSRQRVQQMKKRALDKRDQQSLMDDDEIEKMEKQQAARAVADAVFIDTGVSPFGLVGSMANPDYSEDEIRKTMAESPMAREAREQAFADFLYEEYISGFENELAKLDGIVDQGELMDLIEGLKREGSDEPIKSIAKKFKKTTGLSAWGLEFDEEGNVSSTYYAESDFPSQESLFSWDDRRVDEKFKDSDKKNGSGEKKYTEPINYYEREEYKTYGGSEDLMLKNIEQHKTFTDWTKTKDWEKFHFSHFDWWAFPIDEKSNTYGQQYAVPNEEIKILRQDKEFLERLDENLKNATTAYGWDLSLGSWIPDAIRGKNQIPQSLAQIRLYKMARSALIFGKCSHLKSLQKMYDNLTAFGWYNDSKKGFWATDHPCENT